MSGAITTVGAWVVALAGTRVHGKEARAFGPRRGTLGWKASRFVSAGWFSRPSGDGELGACEVGRSPARAGSGRHARATGTSEVGPHRAPRANSPQARWRDPPKRAVRRENGVSIGSHRVGKPHRCGAFGSEPGRGGVTSPTTVEHGYTKSRSGWMAVRWWCASCVCDGSRGPHRR